MTDFELWYAREHSRVLSTCAALAGDLDAAREATDEAFTRALERWDRVLAMSAPGGWVQTVAINQLHRTWRRRRLELRSARSGSESAPLPDPEL